MLEKNSLNEAFKKAILISLIALVLLIALAFQAEAFPLLIKTNLVLLIVALTSYFFSIFIWIYGWYYAMKKNVSISFEKIALIGFTAMLGIVTPMQLGNEMLRSYLLKKYFNVSNTISLGASFIIKALKLSMLALLGLIIIVLFSFQTKLLPYQSIALISGFAAITLFSLLFLFPSNILAKKLLPKIKITNKLSSFLINYQAALKKISRKEFFMLLLFSFGSWFFEFFSLLFVFIASGHPMPFLSVLVLFILIALLERTPFVPKGIGLVETASVIFLTNPWLSQANYSIQSVALIIILFSFIRIVFPMIIGLAAGFFLIKYEIPKKTVN